MLPGTVKDTKETEILIEIRDAEKKAESIIKRAKAESESIIQEALKNSSHLLSEKQESIMNVKEKEIADFREKLILIKREKSDEGVEIAKQMKSKTQKSIPKAIEFIMQKFEEMVLRNNIRKTT